MCRFLVYRSRPEKAALMGNVVLWPEHSIIKQSYECKERAHSEVGALRGGARGGAASAHGALRSSSPRS
jgi:hypothetical protein